LTSRKQRASPPIDSTVPTSSWQSALAACHDDLYHPDIRGRSSGSIDLDELLEAAGTKRNLITQNLVTLTCR
jgi:hypothetical protein